MSKGGTDDRPGPNEDRSADNGAAQSTPSRSAFRTGYIGVFGRTNVGKSTLLNALLGRKLLISTSKPQATRNRIRCILTVDDAQMIFVDTPGFHQPRNKLGQQLVREAYRGLREIDVLLYVIEPWGHVASFDREALDRIGNPQIPFLLLVNKIDLARGNALEETLLAYNALDRFDELIPISATRRIGLDDTLETLTRYLPQRPAIFPPDTLCDRPDTFLIEEIIREKVFRVTHREVPYSTTVSVKWLRRPEDATQRITEIKADIVVERASQKGIVIGKGGRMIRRIGSEARSEIEKLLGERVFLELIVTVSAGWTHDDEQVRRVTEG